MDRDGECVVCSRVGDVERRLKCVLCGSLVHKHCDSNYSARVFQDKSYVCQGCCHVEKAWDNEEFSYEEYDEKDETGKAWTSGEKKKAMRMMMIKMVTLLCTQTTQIMMNVQVLQMMIF